MRRRRQRSNTASDPSSSGGAGSVASPTSGGSAAESGTGDGAATDAGSLDDLCFLCGRESTTSNKVKAGKMRQLRELWPAARGPYTRIAPLMVCPDRSQDHSHCRWFLRSTHAAYVSCPVPLEPAVHLDVMARCYTVEHLDTFLDPAVDAVAHRRCRGGLLCLLRFVLQLDCVPAGVQLLPLPPATTASGSAGDGVGAGAGGATGGGGGVTGSSPWASAGGDATSQVCVAFFFGVWPCHFSRCCDFIVVVRHRFESCDGAVVCDASWRLGAPSGDGYQCHTTAGRLTRKAMAAGKRHPAPATTTCSASCRHPAAAGCYQATNGPRLASLCRLPLTRRPRRCPS